MTPAELDELLEVARAAAWAGGEVVGEAFGATAPGRRAKGPGDWVSAVDLASERTVRAALARGAPDIAFFGEELGGERAEVGWFVDPLDGTANFLHGFPVFAVSVALVADGLPVVAVVHAPVLGATFTARRGGGAHLDGADLRVSERVPSEAVCATGFPFRGKEARLPAFLSLLEGVLRDVEDCRRAGAASLDLAWTAAGVFDGYFEDRLGIWDVAAGGLLVQEAGGIVTDWRGDPHRWLPAGEVVAGNPAVHAALLGRTRRVAISG